MNKVDVDIAVLGSGFAGSLTAMILQRVGRTVALIDKARHPRFAIGESSTPIANMVLRDLAIRYDLTRLLPLCKYGTWQEAYPELSCGIKRGFSYFAHELSRPFLQSVTHENELLVAASPDDNRSDTQWLRADVDAFLVCEAAAAGVTVLDDTRVDVLEHVDAAGWTLTCQGRGGHSRVRAKFLIDASGEAGVVPRCLGIQSDVGRFSTCSRAIFSHFVGVRDWREVLVDADCVTDYHPFPCDHAAQHHLLDGAWMWMLRFQRSSPELSSLGLVFDEKKHPLDPAVTAEAELGAWLQRYPSITWMLEDAQLAEQPARLIRTGRLQRRWQQFVGSNWALLPHTAGFVDPLHSTGIAHSLCGVERLAQVLDQSWGSDGIHEALLDYETKLHAELDLIDELVSGCFEALGSFDRFVAYSMLYFAAATTYEHRRAEGANIQTLTFLCANDEQFREAVRAAHERLALSSLPGNLLLDDVAELIAPFNRVGLCDRAVQNMYRYTVAPE